MTVSFAGDLLNYLKIASSYIECLTDCWTCLNSTTCSKCLPGYYLREGEIQSCEGKKHHWLATNSFKKHTDHIDKAGKGV